MSRFEKLIDRLLAVPADFTWDELVRVLAGFGYDEKTKSGSHRRFVHRETQQIITGLVKPHRRKHVPRYYLRKIIENLGLRADE